MSGRKWSLRDAGSWLWWWAVEDTRERFRKQWRRVKVIIPRSVAIFVERWLGFWSALFLTALFGAATGEMFRAPIWADTIPGLVETSPRVLLIISFIGLHLTLAAGLLLFALLAVSGLRILRWLRNSILSLWDQQTAPFEEVDFDYSWSLEPASDYSRKRAKRRAKDQAAWGLAILFTLVTLLLIAEREAPNQLNNVLTDPMLAAIGRTLDTTLLGINFGNIIGMTAPNMTQADFVLIILIFGIPGILYLFAARNLLYFFETGVRQSLIHARKDGLRSRTAIVVGFFTLYFILATVLVISNTLGSG